MKAVFESGCVTFTREPGDPKFYGTCGAKGEKALFHFIVKWLNARGFQLIKKLIQRDGHMMGDQFQSYIRTPTRHRKDVPHIYIVSGFYALRGANDDWNKKGEVTLMLHTDVFEQDQQTYRMIHDLCQGREDMRCVAPDSRKSA